MIFLYFSCVFFGLTEYVLNKNNKNIIIYFIVCLVLLSCSPRVGYDTDSFVSIYETIKNVGIKAATSKYAVDRLYFELCNLFIKLGVNSFFNFKFIITALLVFYTARHLKNIVYYPIAFIFLYLSSTFSVDAIQFRNSISLLLFLIGYSFFVTDEKRGDVKFIIFNIFATLFHFSFIIYFLLLFTKMDEKRLSYIIRPIFTITILFYLYTMLLDRRALNIIGAFINFINNEKLIRYTQTSTNLGSLFPFFFASIQIVLLNIVKKTLYAQDSNDDLMINMTKITYYLNIMIFPTVVLNMYSLSMGRFMRNLVPLNLIILTNVLKCKNIKITNKLLYKALLIFIFIFYLIYLNYITGPVEDILYAILNGKLFWIE